MKDFISTSDYYATLFHELVHSTGYVTMNIYAHASVEMQSEAANLMENLVTPIPFSLEENQKQEISR